MTEEGADTRRMSLKAKEVERLELVVKRTRKLEAGPEMGRHAADHEAFVRTGEFF